MVIRAFALSLLISGLLTAPSFAQAVTNMQWDPSGTTPFTETAIDPQQANGMQDLQAQEQQITSIYYNPLDQSRAQTVNGLPPTMMDSFVYEAGGNAEMIYGDEGTTDIPPYFGFEPENHISAGISGTRARGLTTGHGSGWNGSKALPSAWGGDEFGETYAPEFYTSGSPYPNSPGTINIFGIQVHVPNVSIPGVPGGVQSLVGGTNGIGGTNSGF